MAALGSTRCTLAVTNDTNLPAEAYAHLRPFLPGHPAVSKVGLARGRFRELMHHKFMVGFAPEPQFVVTGSFNYTQQSCKHNLENVVIINNPHIARQYLAEARQILAIARPIPCKPQKITKRKRGK